MQKKKKGKSFEEFSPTRIFTRRGKPSFPGTVDRTDIGGGGALAVNAGYPTAVVLQKEGGEAVVVVFWPKEEERGGG